MLNELCLAGIQRWGGPSKNRMGTSMPIKFSCDRCSKSFTVADSAGGKTGRCSDCGHLNTLPKSNPKSAGTPAEPAAEMFEVTSGVTGDVFGPADRATLNQWVGEGRITPECKIKKVGSEKWTAASSIFASLKKADPEAAKLVSGPDLASAQSFEKFKVGSESEAMALGRATASSEVNPFASATVALQPFDRTGDFAPASGNIGFILNHAFRKYQENFGTVLGAAFIGLGGMLLLLVVFYVVFFILIFAAAGGGAQPNPALGVGAILLVLLFYIGLLMGNFYFLSGLLGLMMKVGRGEPASAMDIFASDNACLKVLGHGFVANVLVFGLLMLFGVIMGVLQGVLGLQGEFIEVALGILCFLFIGAAALMMWPGVFLIVDRRSGVMGAFSLGYSVAIKNIGQFIVVSLVAGLIYLAGALVLGIGIVFSLPLAMLIMTTAYLNMTGQIGE